MSTIYVYDWPACRHRMFRDAAGKRYKAEQVKNANLVIITPDNPCPCTYEDGDQELLVTIPGNVVGILPYEPLRAVEPHDGEVDAEMTEGNEFMGHIRPINNDESARYGFPGPIGEQQLDTQAYNAGHAHIGHRGLEHHNHGYGYGGMNTRVDNPNATSYAAWQTGPYAQAPEDAVHHHNGNQENHGHMRAPATNTRHTHGRPPFSTNITAPHTLPAQWGMRVPQATPAPIVRRHKLSQESCPDGEPNCHYHHSVWCHERLETCELALKAMKAAYEAHSEWVGAPVGYNKQHAPCIRLEEPQRCPLHQRFERSRHGREMRR